ncbi:MAG: elongation factor P [Verrucomicrobiota bacterium]
MQTVLSSEFKRGMVLMLDGAPQEIEDFHVSGTAQTRHKLHSRLRNLKTGKVVDKVFAENERLPLAELQRRRVQFSYQQGESFMFSDAETYEELDLHAEHIGDRRWFLQENEEYTALFLDGKFLDITLPPSTSLKVVETDPPVRIGNTSNWKPAKLETGLELMVPLFVETGDQILVDTQLRKYQGKDTTEKGPKG